MKKNYKWKHINGFIVEPSKIKTSLIFGIIIPNNKAVMQMKAVLITYFLVSNFRYFLK